MTKEDIINKLLTYTLETRAVMNGGASCVYYNEKTGNRCAIGALLPIEDAKYLNTVYKTASVNALYYRRHDSGFPESLYALFKDHEPEFLQEIQNIHDSKRYWNSDGLTEDGKDALNKVKKVYLT